REEPGRGTDADSPVRGDAMKSRLFVVAMLLAVPAWAAAPAQPDRIVSVSVLPTTITLSHHRNPHSLQVLGLTADGYTVDLRSSAKVTVDAPKVAVYEDGWVRPVGDGTAKVTVAAAGQTLTIPVTVKLPAKEPVISFRHEVM